MTLHQKTDYAELSKWLHWLIAAMIVVQYLLIELADIAEHQNSIVKQLGLIANHKSIGITILVLAVLRLVYRVAAGAPALPASMPKWQIAASHTSHLLLYLFLFSLPITGWLMSSAKAYTVSWFNLFALPDLIAANEQTANLLEDIHEWLAEALLIVAAIHVAAALKHHLIDKDTVLTRMTSKASVVTSVLALCVMLLVFGGFIASKSPTSNASNVAAEIQNEELSATQVTASDLPLWEIDYQNSFIKFTGEQAGAPFTGTWKTWKGKLQFDHQQLAAARFDVTVDINSVFSNDSERDETILSADFFDAITFPEARFTAQNFAENADQFEAVGTLSMKGIQQPVTLTFTVREDGNNVELIGSSKLIRHNWNIGIGDWADPTWVGSDVDVQVKVVAQIK